MKYSKYRILSFQRLRYKILAIYIINRLRVGKEEGDILTVVFLGTGLGTVNAMALTFIWRNSKNDGNGNFHCRGLWTLYESK